MRTTFILITAAIALAAGLGSASAGEQFTTLEGISAVALAPSAMMSVRGAHLIVDVSGLTGGEPGRVVLLHGDVFGDHGGLWPGGENGISIADLVGKTPVRWSHD